MQFPTVQNPHKSATMPDYSDFVRKNEPNPFEEKQTDYFANFLTENNQMLKDEVVNNARNVANSRPAQTSLGIKNASPNANPFDTENMLASANIKSSQSMQQLTQINNALMSSSPLNGNMPQMPQMEVNSAVQAKAQAQINTMQANAGFKPQGLNIPSEDLAGLVWSTDPRAIPLEQNQGIQLTKDSIKNLNTKPFMLDQNSLSILSRASKRQEAGVLTGASIQVEEPKDALTGKNGALEVFEEQDAKNKNTRHIGELSAQYESGKNGINAVAYDRVGGTSYGKFQIASKPGTFDDFVKYLTREAPDIAEQLKKGGPANTGSRNGRMPEIWKDIAESQPNRFELLQENFIKRTHFDPAFSSLKDTGLDTTCPVLKEVVWSTAVQHGATGAKRIFSRALNGVDTSNMESFINNVYDVRTSQFRSSTQGVQSAIEVRLAEEKTTALNMLT